jgi:RND family efflux transporter MFP subunit
MSKHKHSADFLYAFFQVNIKTKQTKQTKQIKQTIIQAVYTASCLLVSSAMLTSCSKSAEADPRLDPPLVPVLKAHYGQSGGQTFTGTVKSRIESLLGFRVPGKITERLVDTGQVVKKGQPLFKLDRTDLIHSETSRRESVSAQRMTVESKLEAVQSAKAHLVQAEADEKRYKGAVAVGVATEQAYDQYKAALDSARAQYQAAQAEVNAAKNQVSSLQAQEKLAVDESNYSTLVSDADGVVTEVVAEPGQVVAIGQTVIKIARKGPREAVVSLPETLRPGLGSIAEAKVYDKTIPKCSARLRQLSESADALTRTFEARYVLQGKAADAPLGSTVTVSPEAQSKDKTNLVVPLTALLDKGNGFWVWIVDPASSVVHHRPVHVIALGSEDAVVSTGLKEGEPFVSQGAQLLHENDRIRISDAGGDTGPAPLSTPPHPSE